MTEHMDRTCSWVCSVRVPWSTCRQGRPEPVGTYVWASWLGRGASWLCTCSRHARPIAAQDEQPDVQYDEVAWAGRFPVVRGGVATFTLQPRAPFMISVRAEPTLSPRGEPAGRPPLIPPPRT